MPRDGELTTKGKKHRPGRPRKLRSAENAARICLMVEEGYTLPQIAAEFDVTHPAILHWIRDDLANNGGREIANEYTRAVEVRTEMMAAELIDIADDKRFMASHPALASAMVTQQRLAVDTRKWLMAKMLPRKYGDRVEFSGNPDAPVLTRIELVAVHPKPQPIVDVTPSDNDASSALTHQVTRTRVKLGGDSHE